MCNAPPPPRSTWRSGWTPAVMRISGWRRSAAESSSGCSALLADVFVPQRRLGGDEVGHHGDAVGIIRHDNFDAATPEQILATVEGPVLADDHARNLVE